MRLVVDACAAIQWLIAEEVSEIARALAAASNEERAPRPMATEMANVLWRKARMGGILRSGTGGSAKDASGVEREDAVRLALAFDRPMYDCV